jgi:tetratricopeptide (TPR) repeat protein
MKIKIIALFMFLLPLVLNGQTIDDAKDAYNKGAKVFSSDKDSALIYFEQSLGICKIVGAPGDSLRMKIEIYLPGMYFDVANASYKEKKYDEAITKGQKAMQVAESYNDDKNKQRVTKLLIACNFAMANNYFRTSDLDNAIKYYDITVKLDPKFSKAWYNMAQAYMKKGDAEKMSSAMDKTFELAKAENDTATITKATKQCRDFYYKQGLGLSAKNENSAAISSLNKALSFDVKFTDAYYVMASIYNKQTKSKDVLDVCNTALKYETTPAATARFYFQMGYAYVALKQNAEACSVFKKVVDSKDKDLAPKASDILKKNPVLCGTN